MTNTLAEPCKSVLAPPAMPTVLDARVVTGRGGGPEKTILASPRHLEPLGYRMLCAYLAPPHDPGFAEIQSRADRAGVTLHRIPDRGPLDWRVVRDLLRLCRREQVAIWHGHDYKTNALGLLLRRFHPMRLVTTVHGWVERTARTPLYYRIDQWCLPHYERVLCVSEDLHRACLKLGLPASRCLLVENGIDTTAYRRQQSSAKAKERLGLPADCTLIGAVGRLSAEKGFDLLIDAVAPLMAEDPGLHVFIAGEGVERPRLEARAAALGVRQRLLLPGWVAEPRELYEAMDLFVLSSRREGLPNVLLEALAMEVPVVAACVNGVPRLVRDGQEGVLVPAEDAAALTAAIRGLLADPNKQQAFRRAGRERVESAFSFAQRMKTIAAIYDDLLGSTR